MHNDSKSEDRGTGLAPAQRRAHTATSFGSLPEEKLAAKIAQKMGLERDHIQDPRNAVVGSQEKQVPTIGPDCHTGMLVHRWGDDASSPDTGRLELPPCSAIPANPPAIDARSPWSYFSTHIPSAKDIASATAAVDKSRNAAFAASQAAEKGDLDGASEALRSALIVADLSLKACNITSGSEKAQIACRAAKSALNAAEGAEEARVSAEKGDVHGAMAGLDRSRSGAANPFTAPGGSTTSTKKGGGTVVSLEGGTVAYDEPPSSSGRNGKDDANNDGRHAEIGPPYREKFHLPPPGPIPWPFDDKTQVPLPFPFGRFKELDSQMSSTSSSSSSSKQ